MARRATTSDRVGIAGRATAVELLGLTSQGHARTSADDPSTLAHLGLAAEPRDAAVYGPTAGSTPELAPDLDRLRQQVSQLAAEVPERAQPEQVDAWLASFRRLEGAVAGLRTRLVGCVQASRAHEEGGHAGSTTYLKQALGVSGREAARQDKLARDLRLLPQTRQALSDGDIGPEQAQAIGRSARGGTLGDPGATETQLLPLARGRGAEDLSDAIRRLEQEADRRSLESAERRAYRRRRGTLVRRKDGMWDLQALLTDEHGEALATALDAFRTFDPPGTPIPEQRSPQQRTADALADLVRTATHGGAAPTSGGALPQLNIVVPLEALDPDGAAVGELAHGGVLSPGALHRLLCDANLRRLVTRGDSEVLDVGRSRYRWSVAQRQALRVRDGGCRGPGCDRPVAWTHAHHVLPWSADGPTSVDNGLLLCSFHHHQVHEGGWTVTLDPTTAEAVFRSPSGREVSTRPHRRGGPRHSPRPPGRSRGAVDASTTQMILSTSRFDASSGTRGGVSAAVADADAVGAEMASPDVDGAHPASPGRAGAHPANPDAAGGHMASPDLPRTHTADPVVAGGHMASPDLPAAHTADPDLPGTHTADPDVAGAMSPASGDEPAEPAAWPGAATSPQTRVLADSEAPRTGGAGRPERRGSAAHPAAPTLDLNQNSRDGEPAIELRAAGSIEIGRAPP